MVNESASERDSALSFPPRLPHAHSTTIMASRPSRTSKISYVDSDSDSDSSDSGVEQQQQTSSRSSATTTSKDKGKGKMVVPDCKLPATTLPQRACVATD